MTFLLDTHIMLWVSLRLDLLPAKAAAITADRANSCLFSVASVWEVAVKYALKRADFDVDPVELRAALLTSGYTELPITGPHAVAVANLPRIHRDPFDRLLVAQSVVEGITLLTADPVLARYPAPVRLV
jgi:PIN domain nuclease of toxin-antitoxin system